MYAALRSGTAGRGRCELIQSQSAVFGYSFNLVTAFAVSRLIPQLGPAVPSLRASFHLTSNLWYVLSTLIYDVSSFVGVSVSLCVNAGIICDFMVFRMARFFTGCICLLISCNL